MYELLWVDVGALAVGAAIAALDIDVQVGSHKVGRPVYGALVLGGLVGVYAFVVREGSVPLPGYGIGFFALLYLPFLSHSFIDLDTTDRLAQNELETLLLQRDFKELRHASGQDVLHVGKRRLRAHWESHLDGEGILLEFDVHPSLLPITVSRPHVASIRSQTHLEQIRTDIRRRRARGDHSG